ncbi:MAG: GTP 3',8-cyclase MoaA [Actinobacteria bacterium]|nr:MAG: GTP 3',8-cyclase MoaA [Actinomycetota bacterium]
MTELRDDYSRKIDYLRLSITDRCNLRCVYCMPAEGVQWKPHEEILSLEEIELFARAAIGAGLSKIRLTGGEPLVRKGVVELVRSLSEIDGLKGMALTTNGILLPRFATALAGAGLRRVNVSIDSLDEQVYARVTRGGRLSEALSGVKAALEAGLAPVKINVVVARSLDQDFEAFARLTFEMPVDVRFIEYMPVGSCGTSSESDYVPCAEVKHRLEALGRLEPVQTARGWGPATYYRLAGALGNIGFITPQSSHFCSKCNRLRLTADGRLRTCLFSDDEIDVRSVIREGAGEAELRRLLARSLETKPERRPQERERARSMSQIGG